MKQQRGFTIVELLVAVSVAGIASVLMISAFVFLYGGLVVEQTRAAMVLESQLYLRRMVEDIRLANEVRQTNQIADANGPSSGWVTSDPANILIVTQPAVDSTNTFVYDNLTGYPFQNEVVYFGNDSTMYRRTLSNPLAADNKANTTCPIGTIGCPADVELSRNLDNMQFEFYDSGDQVTAVPAQARSVELTVNLKKRMYGRDVTVSNTTRVTLRNER
jgi:prepilin-type N-terminal cleavage/methylation domain-containing protein